jgi:heme exporter protein A
MMTTHLLTLSGLACQREGRDLFDDLDYQVAPGDYVELTGPNGSGKSTLLRSIAGLFADYSGAIEAAPLLYVGHRPAVSPLLSPLDNCQWFLDLVGSDADPLPALARVGLAGFEEILCQQLSAGQQRRVALARLILAQRPLWLLDEPLTALDDSGQRLVCQLIEQHVETGGAVVCATHQSLGLSAIRTLVLGERQSSTAGVVA